MLLHIAGSLLVSPQNVQRRCSLYVGAASKPLEGARLFGDLSLPLPVYERLRMLDVKAPTKIQASAMMPISRREHVVIHAATGSGKTYAYLLPFLSVLHLSRPCQLLIVVPSYELAMQTAATIERLWEHHGTQRAFIMTNPAERAECLAERLAIAACPIVVATPRPLFALVQHLAGTNRLHSRRALRAPESVALRTLAKHLRAVIVDEADAVLLSKHLAVEGPPRQRVHDSASRQGARTAPERFTLPAARALQALLTLSDASAYETRRHGRGGNKFGRCAGRLQFVAASATVSYRLTAEIARLLGMETPESVSVFSEAGAGTVTSDYKRRTGQRGRAGVAVPSAIIHKWVGVESHEGKAAAAAAALRQLRPAATLLFLHEKAAVVATCRALRDVGIFATPLHDAIRSADDLLAESYFDAGGGFTSAMLRKVSDGATTRASDSAREPRVIVSTAESARGLDVPMVDCVILYGLPDSADSYVHLAGRTGRCDRKGVVVSLLMPEEISQIGTFTRQLGVSFKALEIAAAAVKTNMGTENAEGDV